MHARCPTPSVVTADFVARAVDLISVKCRVGPTTRLDALRYSTETEALADRHDGSQSQPSQRVLE